jgi:hypothetical protein
LRTTQIVIAGLGPAIQSLGRHSLDHRVTPGDDIVGGCR